MPKGVVLTIQSHVVRGNVGNRVAAFVLQILGYEALIVNSVSFSNHTGYKNKWTGSISSGEELKHLIEGLEKNNLLYQITHVLTGYIGSTSFLHTILWTLEKIKKYSPSVSYVCDPVMGDGDSFYVPPSLARIYAEEVIPASSVILPNLFELRHLCPEPLQSPEKLRDILKCCEYLHSKGPNHIVCTSALVEGKDLDSKILSTSGVSPSHNLHLIASLCSGKLIFIMEIPLFPLPFTGSGDLMASAFLVRLDECEKSIAKEKKMHKRDKHIETEEVTDELSPWSIELYQKSLELAVNSVFLTLKRTFDEFKSGKIRIGCIDAPELCLVDSKKDIESPDLVVKAVRLIPK
ncbi:Pyridoxine kinase like protein [Aduncisulcus paluster]|uniref:pyridoxal kinase n=1 Tax=Aduncisulcus paluster TaxID=2918883 RepID=A0ABQ5JW78_9EUKA|nr:Pyridoxine kinase like protein [Aduncisulcus paluster]